MKQLALFVLPQRLAVCRLEPDKPAPDWVLECPFCSITRTGEELSIVLPEEDVPRGWQAERGWRGFKVLGPLDFDLTGVLASLAAPLAQAEISMFALSTYNTDYVLVRDADLSAAKRVLLASGHLIEGEGNR